jgi:hypothetical protein
MSFSPITRVFKNFTLAREFPAYGAFSSTATQNVPATTEYLVEHDVTELSELITLTTPTDITVAENGVYYINFSAQANKMMGGGTTAELDMYIKLNGTAVARTATKLEISNNIETLLAVDYILVMNAGDVLQVAAYSPDATIQLLAVPANPPVPAIPSIITNIVRLTGTSPP